MATALNMTARLKQDPESRRKLQALKAAFKDRVQPKIDAALRKSKMVHFARVLVIEDRYIQVLTEFDGSEDLYTEFFRVELPEVFEAIFELVEDAPAWEELNDRETFLEVAKSKNVHSLGEDPDRPSQGYLFSAYGNRTVEEIVEKLNT